MSNNLNVVCGLETGLDVTRALQILYKCTIWMQNTIKQSRCNGMPKRLYVICLRPQAAFSRPRSQFFTIRTDISRYITYLFLSSLSNDFVYSQEKTHASVTVTVVRDRKIRTALRTNQIAEFVTVTTWKK